MGKMRTLLIVALLLSVATAGHCVVESITVTAGGDRVVQNGAIRQIDFSCTADSTDGSFALDTDGDVDGIVNGTLEGWCLAWVIVDPGATGPTDGSPMAITNSLGLNILGASATTLVDNTSTLAARPEVDETPATYPITEDLLVTVTQSVNSAVWTLRYIMVRCGPAQ